MRYTVVEPDGSAMPEGSQDHYRISRDLSLSILNEPGGQRFLENLGYLFINNQIYAPTPETFKAFCAKHGVDVEIHRSKTRLKYPEYLKAYIEKKYPIGALDSNSYSHDIQDDHITAIIIGGPELQKTISKSIRCILEAGTQSPENLCINLDSFTAHFRVILLNDISKNQKYGKEKGRQTLYEVANLLQISPERVDELISIAQQRSINFGLQPKELD
jgi:hypothetical protein